MKRASVLVLALAPLAWVASGQEPAATSPVHGGSVDKQAPNQVQAFLAKHCQECHGAEKPKGKFRVDQLSADFADQAGRERWLAVLKRIKAGEMPPKGKPRPAEEESAALAGWISARAEAVESVRRAAQGRVVLRRLNRVEYTNTVCDLLGIEVDLRRMLVLDGSMDGFDNVGAALHLSSFALERYLEAADAALNLAIANKPAPAKMKQRYSLKDEGIVKLYGNDFYRVLDDGTVVLFISTHDTTVGLGQFYPRDRGYYRFRISASGFQSAGKPVTFAVLNRIPGLIDAGLIDYFDVPADKPTVIEFVSQREPNSGLVIAPYGLGKAVVDTPGKAAQYKGPGLAVHWFEVEGPLYDTWPPVSHRRLFGDLPLTRLKKDSDHLEVVSKEPEADAERIVRSFARRAFRRPVSDDDLKPFLALVKIRLAEKDTFEQAVRTGLAGILSAPQFLFLDEKPGKLDDFALASRLSYFFWSTMPDGELFQLAEQKKLSQPEILRQQVERLLKDPKAAAFTSNFCGQWLSLRDIDVTDPHSGRYPEWDHLLKVSTVKETELFFSELLKNDLSLINVVACDFSMLNGRLAQHYGISGVQGLWAFRKVPLPADSRRGGVLTMASVLKVTADGTNTSPVKRGAWVLERVLGTPPPRPPADVPPLEPDIRGAKTLREQLAKHRNNAACASCHAKIDPPGFALESFDVIGGWRDYYRLTNWVAGAKEVKGKFYLQGPNVDPTGETADGKPFKNIDEFKQLLLRDKDQIARALTERLVTYATGGVPEAADKPEIEAIVAKIRDKNYGLRTLVHEIVQSKMFQNK
jgi:mono/diheme cytochrome c family protein